MPTGFGGGLPPPYRPAAAPPEVFAQAVDALLRHAENLDQDTLQAVQARHRALLAEAATTLSKMAGARGGKATRTKQERDAGKRGLPRVASLEDVDDAFKQLRRDHQFKDPALQASASADDRRHLAVVVDGHCRKFPLVSDIGGPSRHGLNTRQPDNEFISETVHSRPGVPEVSGPEQPT